MSALHYYEGASQEFKTDRDTLSQYWSIKSERMSFTFFDVPPNKEFEMHQHFSEQITYVLEGELFFESDSQTFCLKQGDLIVIPSNALHKVWTGDKGAKAVDAWAPGNESY